MYTFGQFTSRDQSIPISTRIDDEFVQELVDAKAESDEKFTEIRDSIADMPVDNWLGIAALMDKIDAEQYLVLPFSIKGKEVIIGYGRTHEEAIMEFSKLL